MKLGLLVPRYGAEVVGGTEHWLRTLCEHLVADRGWSAEVFTTCAVSAATWADEYPPGTTTEAGVTVHRYRSVSGRDAEYLHQLSRLRREPGAYTRGEALEYIRLVGPVCPEATDAAAAAISAATAPAPPAATATAATPAATATAAPPPGNALCDLIAVTPYLYWPTVTAVPRIGRRVIFHGAAHDEPELYLPVMSDVFCSVGGFAFNSFAERDLVERNFPVGHRPSSVIGNAVDEGKGDPGLARRALGLSGDEPFLLCVGKVETAKGATFLARMWQLYSQRRRARGDRPVKLVFIGPEHDAVPASEDILLAGRQPEEVKWGALAGCHALVAPSAQESFSLVVIEAWLAGRPVVVNARCGPTVEHCRRSGGGLWFEDYGDFEAGVDRLLADAALADRLAAAGGAYARDVFAWPAILDRYEELAGRVLRAAAGATSPLG